MLKFNVSQKVTDILDKEGLAYEIFSELKPNPTVANVKAGVEAFKNANADKMPIGLFAPNHKANEIIDNIVKELTERGIF